MNDIIRVFPRRTVATPDDEWKPFQREWRRPMIVASKFGEFHRKAKEAA